MHPPPTHIAFHVRWLFGLGIALIALPVLAMVYSERHFFEVPKGNEEVFEVALDLSLGTIAIGKTEDQGYLFQAEVLIESEKLLPHFEYEAKDRTGHLSVDLRTAKGEKRAVSIPGLSTVKSSEWILLFGDTVPMDMDVNISAAKAKADFSGLPIRTLQLGCGASHMEVLFNKPNPVEMNRLKIDAGASDLTVRGLAYARAKKIEIDGGGGRFTFDFSGPQEHLIGTHADIELGMASAEIILPRGLPVILEVPESWVTSIVMPPSYQKKKDDLWYSPAVQDAYTAFRLRVDAGFGKVHFTQR